MEEIKVPIYLITGFLESGKTSFLSFTLQQDYFQIDVGLAEKNGIHMTEVELCAEANKWELSHGGISGRTAQQFINYLAGKQE